MPGRVILNQYDPPAQPVFAEPWQAEAFAMTLALHERGVFTWPEWAAALSSHVKAPDAAPDGADYYLHWLAALEDLVATKGICRNTELAGLAEAWRRAAQATPHGHPIHLDSDPLAKDRLAP